MWEAALSADFIEGKSNLPQDTPALGGANLMGLRQSWEGRRRTQASPLRVNFLGIGEKVLIRKGGYRSVIPDSSLAVA
ncbi:hypothetical protein [Candidatus Chlorohelix sp.]|uniref:hypothetical protein n=1 Tax=Candidatus Chlorohelix sp. TaxID=3139201 RepID=UPI00303FE28A